jgi:NAD(P)-dependent dehydrogenase (short-subunit alcohol dehydrogenase family)
MRLLILTGGSRGIGLAVAEEFSARRCTVIEFSRTAPHSYSVATHLAAPLAARRAGTAIARLLFSPALTPGSTHDARDIEAQPFGQADAPRPAASARGLPQTLAFR